MPHTFSSTVDPTAEPLGGPRVMLYGHDSFGLGHLRRCLTLAAAIQARYPHASTLIATGSPCATHFPLPDGVDVLKLPAVTKRGAAYQPLQLRGPLGPVLDLRCATLRAAFDAFEPDLLLVDHTPVGLGGELLPTLEAARRAGVPCVLGLRDIIDSPLHVARVGPRSGAPCASSTRTSSSTATRASSTCVRSTRSRPSCALASSMWAMSCARTGPRARPRRARCRRSW